MSQANRTITDVDLPSTAYHPSSDEFKAVYVNGPEKPNTVSEVEQLMRVAIGLGGRHKGLELAEKVIEFQKEYEKEDVFRDCVVDRGHIEKSNDPWFRGELQSYADEQQAILNEEKEAYDRRMHWYDNQVLSTLHEKMSNASSMLRDGVEFESLIVVDREPESSDEIHVSDLAGMDIRKFGYELPIALTVCISSDSGNKYPFVPWCGTTVCVGPTKHENPVSTLCKHELAALIQYSEDRFTPATDVKVPERFKRLMAPEAYNRFTENISP